MDGFQLDKLPKHIIMGLNPNEEIAKLEFQKLKENEREIKSIEKKIKFTQIYADNHTKVIFELEDVPKILLYKSGFIETSFIETLFAKTLFPGNSSSIAPRHIWAGVLDFPIPRSIIFGRVCSRKRHKGGKYCFATCETLKYELIDRLERLEEKLPDLFPYKIIKSDLLLELLGSSKRSFKAKEILKQKRELIEAYQPDISFTLNLNQNKELIKAMKKIPHFGTMNFLEIYIHRKDVLAIKKNPNFGSVHNSGKFISDIDVSTILIPYKEVTYFHIDQIVDPPKKHCRAIFSLLNTLKELSS